jgi:hypothetical protein
VAANIEVNIIRAMLTLTGPERSGTSVTLPELL